MKNTSIFTLLIAILSSAVAYSLLVLIRIYFDEKLSSSDEIYAYISIFIFLFLGFYSSIKYYGWQLIKHIYKAELQNEVNSYATKDLEAKYNVIKIYPNMESCKDDICEKLSSEKNISIFVQIGTGVLTGKGSLYNCLKKNLSPDSIRILHASVKTKFLSMKEASSRGKAKYAEWTANLKNADFLGRTLSKLYNDGVFETRAHHEGYYWRIFLFDNECFVQPYAYKKNNSQNAPVFRLRNTEGSIYNTFRDYFENKWIEYKPNTYHVNDFIKESFPVSVTAILKFNSLYIFSIPKRYVTNNNLYIQAVGGKVEKDETYKTALIRETQEEINANIRVYSSRFTTYMNSGGIYCSEKFLDDPAPNIIYRRDIDENNRDKRVKWILLYQADLNINSLNEISPQNEIDSVICLSSEMLLNVVNPTTKLTIQDVKKSTDGSCLLGNIEKYNSDMVIHPKGVTSIICNSIRMHY